MMLQKMKGFSVQNRLTLSLFMIAIMCILSSCDKHSGFEKTESGIYKRLKVVSINDSTSLVIVRYH